MHARTAGQEQQPLTYARPPGNMWVSTLHALETSLSAYGFKETPAPVAAAQRQSPGSGRAQDEQTAGNRKIFLEVQKLVANGKVGMEQESSRKTE